MFVVVFSLFIYLFFLISREFGHVSVDKHFTNPLILNVFTDCNRMSCHAIYIKYERLCKNLVNWYILNDFPELRILEINCAINPRSGSG